MSRHNKYEYNRIVKDIVTNPNFLKLKDDIHHGATKFDHCSRVSRLSFLICKRLHLNYVDAARAGMLHDFFYGARTLTEENSYLNHPYTSLRNASENFSLSELEIDIITKHMFPHIVVKKVCPLINRKEQAEFKSSMLRYKESWVICLADVLVSFKEVLRYKPIYMASLFVVFFFNFISN